MMTTTMTTTTNTSYPRTVKEAEFHDSEDDNRMVELSSYNYSTMMGAMRVSLEPHQTRFYRISTGGVEDKTFILHTDEMDALITAWLAYKADRVVALKEQENKSST